MFSEEDSSQDNSSFAEPAVGIVYGDVGTTSLNISVLSKLQKLEYVQIEHEEIGWVIGHVSDIQRKTDLSLDKARMIGQGAEIDIHEKTTAKIEIIGYRDERGLLQVPRTPFRAGQYVYHADDETIKRTLGIKEYTKTGAYIGLLYGHNIRVELDINSLVQKHVSILAKTGGGKSFLCGDLLEELMKHNVTVLVLDPHGEYASMKEEGRILESTRDFQVEPKGYADKIIEFATDPQSNPDALPLRFTLSNIEANDLLSLTNIKNSKVHLSYLKKAIEALRNSKQDYSLKDIINVLKREEDLNNYALICELQYLDDAQIFASSGTKISELVKTGMTTIVNLKGTPPELAELIVNRICTALSLIHI